MTSLSAPFLHDEAAAYEFVESVLWPDGPFCPRCGCLDRITKVKANPEKRVRVGLWRCGHCKRQFTVKVGTVLESSNVKLTLWLQAVVLMTGSKKGISAHQIHRTLGVTYKTAWFMCHRIREAMRSGELALFGGTGGIVEVDETFLGKDPKFARYAKSKVGLRQKMKVLALIDRKTGKARTRVIDHLSAKDITPILHENIAREARVSTDEASYYRSIGYSFAEHMSVNHSADEYVRGEAHTNSLEGYFSIFKRGMKGIYQHCAKKHLHRYASEFEFRYNNRSALGIEDQERARIALMGIVGKRLTYRAGVDS